MLSTIWNKIKSQQQTIFLGVCIILISLISYNIGQINSRGKLPIKISGQNNVYQASAVSVMSKIGNSVNLSPSPSLTRDMRVVVSKNSTTKKYHYTWCPGATKIKEANKVWFNSAKEAEAAGYTLAGNCLK